MNKKTKKTLAEVEESISEESEESEEENDVDLAASSTESDQESDLDLAASSTESDDDDEMETEESEKPAKTRADIIEEEVLNKYNQLKGTRLYVRFPEKLPTDDKEFESKVKSLHPLVANSTKPRQKHARFCLVNFNSKEDRDVAYNDIKASIKSDAALKGIFVSLPKTDSDQFVNQLVARKQQSLEKRKAKILMKRVTKQAQRKDKFTSSVLITNLPKTSSVAQVRKLFENAVDIQITPGRGKFRDFSAATVTLPTTHDARNALKQKLSLGGSQLSIRYNTQQLKRRPKKNAKRKAAGEEVPKAAVEDLPKMDKKKKIKKSKVVISQD